MPFEVVWDDQDPSIVRFDISGNSTWEEAHVAYEKAVDYIQSKPGRVDIVFNELTRKAMPPGNPIPHFKVGFSKLTKPSNAGIICIVTMEGMPKIAQPFVNLMTRLYRLDQSRVGGNFHSLDEARAYIIQDRAKTVAKQAK